MAADQTGTPKYISSRPHISDDWIVEGYFYVSAAPASNSFSSIYDDWVSIGINARSGIQSVNFTILKANPIDPINSGIAERSFEQNNLITIGSWNHVLLVKNSNNLSFYVNGTRRYHSSSPPTEEYSRLNAATGTGAGLQAVASTNTFIDEFSIHKQTTLGYDPSQSSITVPTQPRVNNEYTQFLFHFDGNSNDDVSGLLQSTSATVSSTATVTAQATPNTKSASASLTAVTTQTVSAIKAVESTVTLTSAVDLVSDFDKFRPFSSDLSATATLIDGLERIRFGESTQNALFSPTVTVQATKSGDILLQAEFTAIIDANSFTEVPAALTSQFAVTADIDGITRPASADIISTYSLTAIIGTQESATVTISGAFNAQVNVQYFEGTSLIAPMTASMAVTAQKTARITRTLQSAVTVSADVRENPQAPAANGFYANPFPERVVIDLAYSYVYDRQAYTTLTSASPNRINKAFWIIAYRDGDTATSGDYPQWDTVPNAPLTAEAVFADTTGSSNSATASISFTVYEKDFSVSPDYNYFTKKYSVNAGVVETISGLGSGLTNGSGTIQIILDKDTPNYITVYANGSATPQTISGVTVTSSASSSFIDTMLDRPYRPNNPPPIVFGNYRGDIYSYPDGQPTRDLNLLSITGQSVSEQQETLFFGPQEYAVADLIDSDFASLTASAITVVFLTVGLLASAGSMSTTAIKTSRAAATLSTSSTVLANAGLQAVGTASVNAASTLQASVARTRSTAAAVAVASTIACEPTRVRYQSADISSEFAQTTQAVKQTGNVITIDAVATQTTQGQRIRYADSEFSAFNSTVTAAVKNATGTVTLESEFTQTTQAEKNAVGVITLEAAFTETANTAQGKIVGYTADLTSEFTQITIGDRIQPAGADMVSEFQQSAITNDSKITRITADITATATVTADAERFRDTISLQASLGTLVCQNDTIRFGQAAVTDEFSILASPTFIVRITAEFIAFNSQLTLGEVINIDPFLQLKIPAESRGLFILPENRVITIESETRVNTIKE